MLSLVLSRCWLVDKIRILVEVLSSLNDLHCCNDRSGSGVSSGFPAKTSRVGPIASSNRVVICIMS